jgi:cell division septal protein FtsQ
MSEKRGKILGTVFSIMLISLLLYLIFYLADKNGKGEIEMIEVTGNQLLSEAEYLNFTRLTNGVVNDDIRLPVIKDRFEKHPYVRSAEVEYNINKNAKVLLTEKKIKAVVLIEPDPYFLTNEFQLLPMFVNTKFVDVPVISNPGFEKNIRPLRYLKTENMLQAFKIIDALKMTNTKLSSSLSEINLRNGGDIVLTFSGLKAPVIFGKNGAANKMVYLEMLWDKILDGKALVENSEYVDLRFANEIFIGSAEKTGLLR